MAAKNMENQKYLPNYKSFWYAQRTKVVYQVKLHKHAKFENHTLKNSRVTPLQKTRKMVKFMFFSNNFLTTKYFITTKEQIRWRIAFYIKISNLKEKKWFLRELWAFKKIQDGRQKYSKSSISAQLLIFLIHMKNKSCFS